jgi:hypothetical protein
MTDPLSDALGGQRITMLRYRVSSEDPTRYAATAALECTLVRFDLTLRNGQAQFRPREVFATEEAARAVLDPQLRAWEVWARLHAGHYAIRFEFEGSNSEAWPPPPEGNVVVVVASDSIKLTCYPPLSFVTFAEYAPPPARFDTDDLLEVGLTLLDDAIRMPRHLLKFAFAFLAVASHRYDGRDDLAQQLAFDSRVINDLGWLCTYAGTELEARKLNDSKRIEFTEARRAWVVLVFREILIRHGQRIGGSARAQKFDTRMP